jgi:uncharacterized membrane protein YbhN (UPF0104 family)
LTESPLRKLQERVRPFKRILSWITGGLLLAIAERLLLQNPEPLKQLVNLPAWMWLALLPLALLNYVFVAARMSLAVGQAGGVMIAQRAWFRIVVLGQFLNLLVPQLGNVYRGMTLKREYGVSYQTYATGLFTFVWLDTTFGIGLCLLVLAFLQPGLALGRVPVLPALALLISLLVLAPIVAARLLGKLPIRQGRLAAARERASALLTTSASSLKNAGFTGKFLGASALVMADQSLILWLCFRAVGLPIDPETAALFQVVIKLSNQVIITPGNLGVTEMAFGLMGAAARGGSLEYGIAAALIFRMLFTATVIAMGVMFGGVGLLRSTRAAPE